MSHRTEHPAGNRTPLYPAHVCAGAKIVDFGGWDMPLHYGSQVREHQQVRQHAGMFDVSHMTVIDVTGADALAYLRHLLANDVAKLKPGAALYSVMLNHQGGVVDDLIVYYLSSETYRLVVNCATRDKDLTWIQAEAKTFAVNIAERADLAIIAVQGPQALAALDEALVNEGFIKDALVDNTVSTESDILEQLNQLPAFHGMTINETSLRANSDQTGSGPWFIARTGYTGEDGVEIILPGEDAEPLWNALHAAGVEPVGLGARDTLRLEAGMNLYGHEMDDETSPLEANLGWTIAWQPEDRDFVGRKALTTQREQGPGTTLVGLLMTERGVLREGQIVSALSAEQSLKKQGLTEEGPSKQGIVTSGTFSPTLQQGIALARVPIALSQQAAQISVEIRGKAVAVQIVKPPFVRHGKTVYRYYKQSK
ncbi:MAG: glycine cleavage system aminomethyltransferase GcvT [Porticoccaceae bacterium]|nr:glycine cleavage system aminomethyltransferase GcvT [Porticoccaceae bacterium]